MASNSSRVESINSAFYQVPSAREGSSADIQNSIKNLTHRSRYAYAYVALTVISVVGIIIIALSLAGIFGPINSSNFIVRMVVGCVITAVPVGGLIWIIAVNCCKNHKRPIIANEEVANSVKNNGPDTTPIVQEDKNEILNDEAVIRSLGQNLKSNPGIAACLRNISSDFFEEKSQSRAKRVFSQAMREILNSDVAFPKASLVENPESLNGALHKSVFHLATSKRVNEEIRASSKDPDRLHVYQVASQYNAAEAPTPETPPIGAAMQVSEWDPTQGPQAQRTNPEAFELVTAFLTHLGFNMLNEVLPSAGKTYQNDSPIQHGYLRPNDENIESLTDEFIKNYSKAEYVCYSSSPSAWGGINPVYLFLQAAPAIKYSRVSQASSDELQKYAALANYLALFKYGIELAETTDKPIVLHATAVGGGAFSNSAANLRWGFEKAGLTFQSEMEAAGVVVQLEVWQPGSTMEKIGSGLGIPY